MHVSGHRLYHWNKTSPRYISYPYAFAVSSKRYPFWRANETASSIPPSSTLYKPSPNKGILFPSFSVIFAEIPSPSILGFDMMLKSLWYRRIRLNVCTKKFVLTENITSLQCVQSEEPGGSIWRIFGKRLVNKKWRFWTCKRISQSCAERMSAARPGPVNIANSMKKWM